MSSAYVLVAGILVYIGMVRAFARYDLGVIFSAVVTVIGIFCFNVLFLKLPAIIGFGAPLSSIFTLNSIVTAILQIIAALLIFRQLKVVEDTIGAWFSWAIIGGIIIPLAIPLVVSAVVGP